MLPGPTLLVRRERERSWRLANIASLSALFLLALGVVLSTNSKGTSFLESKDAAQGHRSMILDERMDGVPSDMIEMIDFTADPCEDAYQVGCMYVYVCKL